MQLTQQPVRSRLRRAAERRFGVDSRSLAAFRVGLGVVLLVDLLLRARNLQRFYTDSGYLPVALLRDQYPVLSRFSLHALSGGPWLQIALFGLAAACAVALCLGYRTRLATAASLGLLVSLHARNPYVLSGGDALLQHLLFWSLFLPLGARWSVDARRGSASRERVVSLASAAILLQVFLVYGVNAVLKHRSEAWSGGTAVADVLALDQYAVAVGPLVSELPALLWAANWGWVLLLFASPLLVLSTGRRRAALVAVFAAAHLGMLATIQLGVFPLVSVVALAPFLPAAVWDADEGRGVSASLRRAGERILAGADSVLPRMSTPHWPGAASQWGRRLGQCVVAVALVGVVLVNAVAVGFVPVPPGADGHLTGEPSDSRWTLFAPNPPVTDRWYVATGRTADGQVTLFVEPSRRWDRGGTGAYTSARLRKYLASFRRTDALRPALAASLCSQWNRTHDAELTAVSVTVVERAGDSPPDRPPERTTVFQTSCSDATLNSPRAVRSL